MVDAFPLSAADPDRQIQLLIDSDLQSSQIEDARYPALLAAQDCRPWVTPLLRRLAWHDARHTARSQALAQMLEIAMLRSSKDPASRWSTRLHRDIVSMEPQRRAQWMSALADAPSECRLPAIQRLGNAELEDGLQRWIALLNADVVPHLTPADAAVLQQVIALCDHLGGPAGGQFLYDIALVPWSHESEHAWMNAYLPAIDRLSPDRAFACLDALMRNPSTALPDVRRRYDALLAMSDNDTVAAEPPFEVDGQLLRMAVELNACQPPVDEHQTAEDGVAAR